MIECIHYCIECDAEWFHQVDEERMKCEDGAYDLLCSFHVDGGKEQVVTTEKLHEHMCEKQGEIWSHRKEICENTWEWSCPEHE